MSGTSAMAKKKETVFMCVAVHPVKARLWREGYIRRRIKPGTSLREVGELVGVSAPQIVKHHLESMVKMGAIDYVGGEYVFPRRKR